MLRKPKRRWTPKNWASWKPFGIGEQRPNNFGEVWRAARENRDQWRYAWRILNEGVCDGCALGTKGLKDWTTPGVHLCNVRLRLLRLNTMPPLDLTMMNDLDRLRAMKDRELRALGRLPTPMVKYAGQTKFAPVTWETALHVISQPLRAMAPHQLGLYVTSRGTTNETYYLAQKAARALGTNSVDNAARICHAPSTSALRSSLGIAATSCSYRDWIGTDLILFFGSNVANNQPVAVKYLHMAKKAGTKIVVINPFREPGMERYWIPSLPESALFGTKIADDFYPVTAGGDRAFIMGVCKELIARRAVHHTFIEKHTTGFAELQSQVENLSWESLEEAAGCRRDHMVRLATLLQSAEKAVFVWSMGITQHARGEDNVRAILNLALLGGHVGREGCGVMPIRGHSGVQGGAEMGCYTHVLPGGIPLNPQNAARFGEKWGFSVPEEPGLKTPEMIAAADKGELKALIAIGGNFVDVLPDGQRVAKALGRLDLRVHFDIVLSRQMLLDCPGTVVLLPATTRYEVPGGVTETTTERRVILSPEIPGPRIPDARPEWEVLAELVRRVKPELAKHFSYTDTAQIRAEIAQVVPEYGGLAHLVKGGDSFQIGGDHLCAQWQFPTADGFAHFHALGMEDLLSASQASAHHELQEVADAKTVHFRLSCRRGKQFNSMIFDDREPLTGTTRDEIMMNKEDCRQLGLSAGDWVRIANGRGHWLGRVRLAEVTPRNLLVHWPECNHLLDPSILSPEAGIPDFHAQVTCERAHDPNPLHS